MPREKNPVERSKSSPRASAGSHRAIREEIVVDGKRLETLRYLPLDTEGRPTIVLLHEGLGSISMWRNFPEELAAATDCAVLVYSRYGHGSSQRLGERRAPDFMHHEARVVLPRLLAHVEVERPLLLGHSDGGSIALIYAGTSPESPRALILEAPHVFVEDWSLRSIRAIRKVYEKTDLRAKLAKHHDHVDETFYGWNDIWLDPAFRSWNIEEYLQPISCPVLVIQGEQDEYGTRAQVAAIKERVPAAETLILPRCGHSPHRDAPEKTLEAVSKFVLALR
jgi:pimeloyl-ACP methyl ester carboxylesterase